MAILSSSGIGFGLMLMLVLGAFSAGVQATIKDNFSQVVGIIEISQAEQSGDFSRLPTNIIEKLYESEIGPEIKAYNIESELSPLFTRYYTINNKLKTDRDTLGVKGLNASVDAIWGGPTTKIREGRLFNPGANEVILDSRIADNKESFQINTTIGSTITLYLSFPNLSVNLVDLTIVGIYEQEDLGAPEFVPRQYNLYTSMETAWALREQGWLEIFPYYDYYTKVNLLFDVTNSSEAKDFVNKLNSLTNLGVAIETYSLAQFGDQLASSFSVIDTFTAVISIITALAGGMAIIAAQLNSVTQRMSEFAILKATGWKNRHIFKDIVGESLILGLMGSAIAVLLGWGIISLFSSGFGPFGSIRTKITIDLITMIFGFGLAVGIIAGLYPGYKAASIRPVQVLKGG